MSFDSSMLTRGNFRGWPVLTCYILSKYVRVKYRLCRLNTIKTKPYF